MHHNSLWCSCRTAFQQQQLVDDSVYQIQTAWVEYIYHGVCYGSSAENKEEPSPPMKLWSYSLPDHNILLHELQPAHECIDVERKIEITLCNLFFAFYCYFSVSLQSDNTWCSIFLKLQNLKVDEVHPHNTTKCTNYHAYCQ
jgi:hypothetical protein